MTLAQKPALTTEQRVKVLEMYAEGIPCTAIANMFQVSRNTILRVCKPEVYAKQLEGNKQYNAANAAALDARKKERTKSYSFSLSLVQDSDVIAQIDQQENMTGYFRDLVRQDIKKRSL